MVQKSSINGPENRHLSQGGVERHPPSLPDTVEHRWSSIEFLANMGKV
jgi:hypothetical protein